MQGIVKTITVERGKLYNNIKDEYPIKSLAQERALTRLYEWNKRKGAFVYDEK